MVRYAPGRYTMFRWTTLLLAVVLAPSGAGGDSGQPLLAAEIPLHLEEHLDDATIIGSEVQEGLPEPVEWRFDELQPDWKPVVTMNPSTRPVKVEQLDDALRLMLDESGNNLAGAPRGGIAIELPDWNARDWGYIVVRARSSEGIRRFTIGFNTASGEAGTSRSPRPYEFTSEWADAVNDGTVQTYLLRAQANRPWWGTWHRLGVWVAAGAPATFEILSISVIPTEADYAADLVYEIAEVNGFSMAYLDVGEGEPLVLLHGIFGTGAIWSRVLDDFTAHYRVILPDLRGHGRSTNPDGTFTHRQSARDVFALLDQLGVDRFRGMGSSAGAVTLLHMATGQPERVEAMVLLDGTTYLPETARESMRGMDPDAAPAEVLEGMAQQQGHVRGAEQVRALMTVFRDLQHSYDDVNFTPPYLSTIIAPTLIVHGDRDRFFPVSIAVEMYEAIPNSYLWIVPNSDHPAIIGTESGHRRLAETALDFLSGAWERR